MYKVELKGKLHKPALERTIIGQRRTILRIALQRYFVLFLHRHTKFSRNILSRSDHRNTVCVRSD
jgi:hypothetical protein